MYQFLSIFAGKLNDEENPYQVQELEKMSLQAIKMLQQTMYAKMREEQESKMRSEQELKA